MTIHYLSFGSEHFEQLSTFGEYKKEEHIFEIVKSLILQGPHALDQTGSSSLKSFPHFTECSSHTELSVVESSHSSLTLFLAFEHSVVSS